MSVSASQIKTILIAAVIIFLILNFGFYYKINKWNKSRLNYSGKRVVLQLVLTDGILIMQLVCIVALIYSKFKNNSEDELIYGLYLFFILAFGIVAIASFFATDFFKKFYVWGTEFTCSNCDYLITLSNEEMNEGNLKCPKCNFEAEIEKPDLEFVKKNENLKAEEYAAPIVNYLQLNATMIIIVSAVFGFLIIGIIFFAIIISLF